ncbi:hypothetical protein [Actinoplanes sp. NPDC048796]|uniref:hypothetical protein n=1 Tax=unclassified Actinoplanes TaxID=2626549 RepID=UPI0033F0ADA9
MGHTGSTAIVSGYVADYSADGASTMIAEAYAGETKTDGDNRSVAPGAGTEEFSLTIGDPSCRPVSGRSAYR